jgi:hypothetical protein
MTNFNPIPITSHRLSKKAPSGHFANLFQIACGVDLRGGGASVAKRQFASLWFSSMAESTVA